jgi:hypothetical protein
MALDFTGRDIGGESRLVNQQGFVHDGGIGCQAMGWDLVCEDEEVCEGV